MARWHGAARHEARLTTLPHPNLAGRCTMLRSSSGWVRAGCSSCGRRVQKESEPDAARWCVLLGCTA